MARHGFESEADLAARVVNWLREDGWKVYQEVDGPGGVADIVAVKGTTTLVVECKLSLNLHVLEQAQRWKRFSYFVAIAVPHYGFKSPDGYRFGFMVAKQFGISTFQVSPRPVGVHWSNPTTEKAKYDLLRFKHGIRQAIWENRSEEWHHKESLRRLGKYLHDEQQTFAAAGSPTGKRWTPFKGTVQSFTKYVTEHPGCTIKEVCTNAKHHWRKTSNAIASMRNLVVEPNPKRPPFPGIRAEHDPALRAYKLYPSAG